MKKTLALAMSALLMLVLATPVMAQTGGGSTGKSADSGKSAEGTKESKSKSAGHKGGKKGKKSSGGTTTQPPK